MSRLDSNSTRLTCMGPGNFLQCGHIDDETVCGDDRNARDVVHKLTQQFLMKNVDSLHKVGDKSGRITTWSVAILSARPVSQ